MENTDWLDEAIAAIEPSPAEYAGQTFAETLTILEKRKLAPWAKTQLLADWQGHTFDEAYELLGAIDHGDIAEEIGDVIADAVTAALVLEDASQGKYSVESILRGISEKIKRRIPWIATGGEPPATAEEEHATWLAVKAEEKRQKESTTT